MAYEDKKNWFETNVPQDNVPQHNPLSITACGHKRNLTNILVGGETEAVNTRL